MATFTYLSHTDSVLHLKHRSTYITDGAKVYKMMDIVFHKALVQREVNHL